MAKLKLNSLLADMRGRFGSVVISSNATGNYVKVLVSPKQTVTYQQSIIRSRFSTLITAWNQLTALQRNDWKTYSLQADNERLDWFGDPYYPNARAQFISINLARSSNGETIAESPPAGNLPAALPTMNGGVDPSGVAFDSYIDHDGAFDGTIKYVYVGVSITPKPGRGTPIMPYKFLGIKDVSGAWPWLIQSTLDDLYGVVSSVGSWWLSITPLSDEYRPGTTSYINAAIGTEV